MNTALSVSASALAGLDYDADGDALAITAVSGTSTNGGLGCQLELRHDHLHAGDEFVGSDQFTYTISDGYPGGTATSTANVTVRLGKATSVFNYISRRSASVDLRGYGIPGHSYDIQKSSDSDFSTYIIVATVTAAANGIILYTDTNATNHSLLSFRRALTN